MNALLTIGTVQTYNESIRLLICDVTQKWFARFECK